MRIAIVSAHYPPNFVSGGTLVPQRIAEHLAARGHQVFVFAGELTPGQPDLMTRVDVVPSDGPDIEVTWVSLTGRLSWNERHNYAGADMMAVFGEFLRRVRPDAVHLHSLQGLGGGLVPLAAASGAATVVTMHDMWWWCARQFLVEQNLHPCSIVVDSGVCPCAADNRWLRARNAELAADLSAADLVLAPSIPMLSLLAANGVAPARLALDENPAPDSVRHQPVRPARDRGAPVRFVFAGGRHAVKGGPLALEAAKQLGDLPGWSLDLYGIDKVRMPRNTRALPPYDAAEVPTVLAGYDVLVMSSVMLESYSLLTREALAAGCVVITGDNPGPVEVVHDGVNGLVVPRGDAAALAAAMRSLVADPDLLRRLQPTPGVLALRSQDEQAAGLEAHFRRVLDGRPAAVPPARRPLQRVLMISGITGAPLRYRGFLPAEALAGLGVHVEVVMYRDQRIPELAASADAVVLYRVPATDQILDVIAAVRDRAAVPVLFDIDDLIVDPGLAGELNPVLAAVPGMDLDLYWQGVRRYRTTLEACDGYIGSTSYLCERVGELTGLPTYRFANGVGRELARVSDAQLRRPRKSGPLRVGYFSGTNTHNEDWAHIEPALVRLLVARPQIQLWIGGLLETSEALRPFSGRISRLPFAQWFELPALLRDLDINLAPLQPGRRFNEAKSAIKFLEAALVATPTVAAPSEPFREAITDGVNGLLASTPDEWFDALTRLVDDPALRARLGHAALDGVLTELPPARQGHRYRDILLRARAQVERDGHREQFAGWQPEATSEPFVATSTEFYGPLDIRPDGRVRRPHKTAAGVRRYAAAARQLLEREGVAATVKRGAREVRSRLG